MDEPDPALIRAAANGDQDAFAFLVRAYQARIWRFLCRLVGDRTLAEDVTQETFLRVYTRLPTFGFRSKFSTWTFAIARNAGIDALRARTRRSRLDQELTDKERHKGQPPPRADLDLEAAIAALPAKLKEAFLLVEVIGLRYEEAADVLRVPVGTIKSRLHHARKALIHALGSNVNEM
jgi:RNA polymerase sigma-70 factor (ECF subfamily)